MAVLTIAHESVVSEKDSSLETTQIRQDAEERYYKRRGPDAGRPSPLPAQSPSKKSAAKKTKLKRKKKLQVEISAVERAALHGSLSWVPRSPPAAQRSLQLDDIREPAARNKNDSRGSDVLVVSDLPLSPLMRSERDLDALEDSIMTEVRDLSNSYGAISLAASSARASGYGGATFDPALEGLATKIIRKEEQLQMVGQTRKSIHESFDLSSDEDDGSGDYCGTNNEKRRGRRGTALY
ncbi:Hypothetical Protein FCC1311_072222 [Hondaea fermentalgiana]|uniref:Uncharacterized protein n=1 Tax=Hondaea fermentalgiana TaxID=2315210 RepID=A0A2R5GRN3_9STRA|nr:Hypothetical Protein FCC1311_072222 [Hondaea fermentalgiana]|eukprot:GBG31001.1 Hypothetical Protein FCC1311_072222 [Hondaea fermentalgiana]